MTIEYFKQAISEELSDARKYMDKAIECKAHHKRWSDSFYMMSTVEVSHAATLMKMVEEMSKESKDAVTDQIYLELMKEYGDTMTYITNMRRGL